MTALIASNDDENRKPNLGITFISFKGITIY